MRRPTPGEVVWLVRHSYDENPVPFWLVGMAAFWFVVVAVVLP